VWVDDKLADWPDDDFRLFVGNLGGEATDELLGTTFAHYPSFQRSRVVKDRYTNRNRGYGFVSFADPFDCARALREMQGSYCGTRPMSLRKSTWHDRAVDSDKDKIKMLAHKKKKKGGKKHLW